MPVRPSTSVEPHEIDGFSAVAGQWWDPQGPFRMLHQISPMRVAYVCEQIKDHLDEGKDLTGLRVLDVGCGGGLMAEALAKKGAIVTGIDASAQTIEVAKAHAQTSGLSIDYRVETAEGLAKSGEVFDVVMAFEIVEHVANLKLFMQSLGRLVRPGGLVLASTMNRTKRSFLLGIVMAEYVLRWVPAGTHDWDKFVRPSEMTDLMTRNGLEPRDLTGFTYRPLTGAFVLAKGNAAVNYFMAAKRVNV